MSDPIPTYYWGDTGMERDRAGNGLYVLAADAEAHETAAVAAARREGVLEGRRDAFNRDDEAWHDGYEQGQRDAEARIRAGVEALITQHHPMPPEGRSCVCHAGEYRVLAVIDAAPQGGE